MLRFSTALDDSAFVAGLRRMASAAGSAAADIQKQLSSINSVGSALSALGPAGTLVTGLAAVAVAGDSVTSSLARINAATGNMDQANDVYAQLRDLAGQTGVAVADSAGQFTRFSIAARQIGATNAQVVSLISLMQKAGVVGGSTSEEISSVGIQLGQALASGRLQGDELRSIMENMPLLAEALAKQLGVGIGKLREMGKEGGLTADTVFPALLKASDDVNKKFEAMPVTLARSLATMKAGIASFAGEEGGFMSEFFTRVSEGLQGYGYGNGRNDRKELAEAEAEQARLEQIRNDQILNKYLPLAPKPAYEPTSEEKDQSIKSQEKLDAINRDMQDSAAKAWDKDQDHRESELNAWWREEDQRRDKVAGEERKMDDAQEARKLQSLKNEQKKRMEAHLQFEQTKLSAANSSLSTAQGNLGNFNRSGADQRRQMNRDALDERRFKAREERMNGNEGARFGDRRMARDIDKAENEVKFAQGEIDRLTTAIDALLAK